MGPRVVASAGARTDNARAVRRIGGGRKLHLSLAIPTLVAAAGCGSGGGTGVGPDGGRLAACLPACIADRVAYCPIPAGACTSENVSNNGVSSCYAGGIQLESYTNNGAGSAVDIPSGVCYEVLPRYTVVNHVPRLQSIDYFTGGDKVYGCIGMDPADPNNRKGTVWCDVDCDHANVSGDPGQPFDFDNPACSFFQFQPCGPGCSMTDGVVYDDPSQVCTLGPAGTCPLP